MYINDTVQQEKTNNGLVTPVFPWESLHVHNCYAERDNCYAKGESGSHDE